MFPLERSNWNWKDTLYLLVLFPRLVSKDGGGVSKFAEGSRFPIRNEKKVELLFEKLLSPSFCWDTRNSKTLPRLLHFLNVNKTTKRPPLVWESSGGNRALISKYLNYEPRQSLFISVMHTRACVKVFTTRAMFLHNFLMVRARGLVAAWTPNADLTANIRYACSRTAKYTRATVVKRLTFRNKKRPEW